MERIDEANDMINDIRDAEKETLLQGLVGGGSQEVLPLKAAQRRSAMEFLENIPLTVM